MPEGKVVTVRLSEKLHSELKAYCESNSRSMNALVTELIQSRLVGFKPIERTLPPPPQPKPVEGFRDQSQNERGAD